MKLALPFYFGIHIEEIADEFNVDFKKTSNAEKMIEFIETYPDKQINIHFTDGVDFKRAKEFSKISDNVYICLDGQDFLATFELFKNKIPFFFGHNFLITSYTQLKDFVENIGVSAVYIGDDLVHNIEQVADYCHSHDIKIRLVANRIPSASSFKGINAISWFLIPEEVDYYQNFIDVIEFDCETPDGYDYVAAKALKKIFFEKKRWKAPLKEINKDLQSDILGSTFKSNSFTISANCKLGCMVHNSHCNFCQSRYQLAEALQEKKLT